MLSVQQACSVTTPPDVVHVNHSLKDVNVIYVRSTILVSPTVNRAHATDTRTNVTSWPDNVRDVNIILMVSIVICVQKDSTETPAKVGFFKQYFWEFSLKKTLRSPFHFTKYLLKQFLGFPLQNSFYIYNYNFLVQIVAKFFEPLLLCLLRQKRIQTLYCNEPSNLFFFFSSNLKEQWTTVNDANVQVVAVVTSSVTSVHNYQVVLSFVIIVQKDTQVINVNVVRMATMVTHLQQVARARNANATVCDVLSFLHLLLCWIWDFAMIKCFRRSATFFLYYLSLIHIWRCRRRG